MTFTERGNTMGVFIMCNKDQKIRDLEREVVELREEKYDLSAENTTLLDLYRSKRSEADMYWAACKKQGEIIIDLQSENEVLKKQNEALFKQREGLCNENAKLSAGWADFDALYEKLNTLGSERDQAIKEKVRLEVIRDDILKENQRLKDDRTYLHTELARRGEAIDALKKVIDLYSGAIGYQEKRKG